MTPAEIAGLTRMAQSMSDRDLAYQINDAALLKMPADATQIFRDEQAQRAKKGKTVTPQEHAMIGELNAYRKILKMKEAKFRGSPQALAEAVVDLARRVLKIEPDNAQAKKRIGAPVVADGAYKNNREAQNKTSHTTNGKTASQTKKEERRAKHVAKSVGALTKPTPGKKPTAPSARTAGNDRKVDDGEMHLSDIAAHIKMQSKHARARARKHAAAIGKLEVKGKKYVFSKANRDKVAAILKG